MKVYALVLVTDNHGHGRDKEVISVSTNKKLIFNKAAKLSGKAVSDRYSWRDDVYWVHVFDNKSGKKLDELEFDSNGQQEGTFGKIVSNRGSIDEKVVGSWKK